MRPPTDIYGSVFMWRSPEIPQLGGIAVPLLPFWPGWNHYASLHRLATPAPRAVSPFGTNGSGNPTAGPIRLPHLADRAATPSWTPAVVKGWPVEDPSAGEYGLLDLRELYDDRLPQEGLLNGAGSGFARQSWSNYGPPFKPFPPSGLFWRIADDEDDEQPSPTPEQLYPEYYDLRKELSKWAAAQYPDLIREGDRIYYPEVRALIEQVATASPAEHRGLRTAIDQMRSLDSMTRNIFHRFLSDRLEGESEEYIRSALLEEVDAGVMANRRLRDQTAKAFVQNFLRPLAPAIELLDDVDSLEPGYRADENRVSDILSPELLAELRYALDAFLAAEERYALALAAQRSSRSDTKRRSLMQMNSLMGTAREELHKLVVRAEGKLLRAGYNFRAPSGYRFPDGSFAGAGDGPPQNIEVKPNDRKIRAQREKDEWAERVMGIKTTYVTMAEIIRRARRLLGEEE